jgi:predicted tellurium resistance membrane protein TerC
MMDWIGDPQAWAALAALTSIEVVLGLDNIIFITILVARLPARQRSQGRSLGLAAAMLTRIALLFSLTWFMRLTDPLFSLLGRELSLRDLILMAGGLFLIAKSTFEIHAKLEGEDHRASHGSAASFISVIVQIALLDIVFSIDSVITAIGLAEHLAIMVIAIILAVLVMLLAAKPLGNFVERHPTIMILALSFLLLIGTTLMADSLHFHIPKGYVYFAMAFAVFVEALNTRMRRVATEPVKLRDKLIENGDRGRAAQAGSP